MGWFSYVIGLWILCGLVAAYIASSRGEAGGKWFFLGLIFGVFAVIGALFTGAKCPYCQSRISSQAVKCPRCQSDLATNRQMMKSNTTYKQCPWCGHSNPATRVRCESCQKPIDVSPDQIPSRSASINRPLEPTLSNYVICPHCGERNLPSQVYCLNCNNRMQLSGE
jgi:hypothetical protein